MKAPFCPPRKVPSSPFAEGRPIIDEATTWPRAAERLLESIPGVTSASLVGSRQAVEEVRLLYEPGRPVGEILDAVRTFLETGANARLTQTRFHIAVAPPTEGHPRRWGTPVRATPEPLARFLQDYAVGFVAHHVSMVQPGVMRVEVQISCRGRTFSGAVLGRIDQPSRIRLPALATLRALDACVQILYQGVAHPTLVLDSVVETKVAGAPVAVVAVTTSEGTRPIPLTAAWPLAQTSELAVILAVLQATGRTVSRWLAWEDSPPREDANGAAR